MERQRVILLVLVIAWTIFRLVRYVRMSGARRPPPSGTAARTTMTAASPIEPAGSGGAGLARSLVPAAIFVAGAVVIWSLLFLVPAFENVPTPVRMIAGVLATLYLIQLARRAAARFGATGQRGGAEDNNPIK